MVLDPKNIVGPSAGESSNIAGPGYITNEALPYIDFGGVITGKQPGLTIAGRNPLSQGRFMSLKGSDERSKIYSENVSANVNAIISDMRAQGYTQQSGTRLVKDLGGGTQSILDIDPATGQTNSTQYTEQVASSKAKSSSSGRSQQEVASKLLASLKPGTIISPEYKAKLTNIASYNPAQAEINRIADSKSNTSLAKSAQATKSSSTISNITGGSFNIDSSGRGTSSMQAIIKQNIPAAKTTTSTSSIFKSGYSGPSKDSKTKNRELPSFKIDPNHSRHLDQFLKRRNKW